MSIGELDDLNWTLFLDHIKASYKQHDVAKSKSFENMVWFDMTTLAILINSVEGRLKMTDFVFVRIEWNQVSFVGV